MSRRNFRTKSPPFVMLPRWVTHTVAWRHLDPSSRALYLELRERFNGHNNGTIGFGCREAARAIDVGHDTANRALRKLTEYGFIEAVSKGEFSQNGRRATEWLWPNCRTIAPGTNQPKHSRRGSRRIQKLVRPQGRMVLHIRR